MEGEEYLGASALHLAIAYSNNELVNDLIDAGADVHQRATGRFFLPRDQQSNNPAKNTDYDGLAYLGEYPLAWAACVNNESVYNLLLEVGADPDAQDSFGNMILHMVVVGDKLDMFGYALRFDRFLMNFRLPRSLLNLKQFIDDVAQTSEAAGEERNRQRGRTHSADARMQAGPLRSLPRDVGIKLSRILALQQHHMFSLPA